MSFIVKGFDIPKNAMFFKLSFYDEDGDTEYGVKGSLKPYIIQIPKGHGRLIDVDNIDYDDFWHREGQGFTIAVCQGAQRIIEEQPTIIEAEK